MSDGSPSIIAAISASVVSSSVSLTSQYNQLPVMPATSLTTTSIVDGPYELNQITYNFDAGNGFTAVASVEDTNSGCYTVPGN